MTGDWTDRVESILLDALELEAGERAALLEAACAGDAALRAEVEALLRARETLGGFLEDAPLADLADEVLPPGTRIGRYEIREHLATGGAGQVYVAEQDRPRRRVALKVLRAGLRTPASVQRFQEEAEILARLQHPGIAHVYEAGTHEGYPFIALEYVADARAFVAHARGLPRGERLALFARVCDAVQHGHQKGVAHLDLKPANVLVLPTGDPKIIDFGIARVAGLGDAPGGIVGTPPYMSPEQFEQAGGDVDSRADVYALGVLLYEIENGRLPHVVTGLPIAEIARRTRFDAPDPVDAALPADVRAIIAKALSKDREGRYASAAALGDDVREFLAHRPVAARRAPRLHLVSLFVRRHRPLVAALLALATILIGATFVSMRFASEAIEARDRERVQAYRANLSAAHAALRLNDVTEARRRLAGAPTDLRRFEWDYLAGLIDASERTLRVPGESECLATVGPAGNTIWTHAHGAAGAGSLRIWDLESGAQVASEPIDEASKTAPVFSPDGQRVAWGDGSGHVRVVDAATREPVVDLAGHDGRVNDIAFSPDGSLIASSSDDGTVRLASLATGELAWSIGAGAEPLYEICFAADGSSFAVSRRDFAIDVWDVGTRTLLASLSGHRARVTALFFAATGRQLVSGARDGTLRVWDVEAGHETVRVAEGENPITCGALAPDGTGLLTGHASGAISLWDLASGRRVASLLGHEPWPLSVAFTPDGRRAVSASMEGRIKVWDLATTARVRAWDDYGELVRDVAYSRDGKRLATGAFDGSVRVYTLDDAVVERRIATVEGGVQSVALDAHGERVAAATTEGEIHLWDVATGESRMVIGEQARVHSIEFSPDGKLLASGSSDHRATLWDLDAREARHVLPHTAVLWSTVFSADGNVLATTSADGWLRIWSVKDGSQLHAERAHAGELSCAAFSPDGATLVAGGENRIHLWDTRTWARRASYTLPFVYIQGVAPLLGGRRIAVAASRNVAIVDASDGTALLELKEHATFVWDIAAHPDGTQLATAAGGYSSEGCELRIWGRLPGRPWPPRLADE